jgi:uncharacterized protein (TIGR03435 family)
VPKLLAHLLPILLVISALRATDAQEAAASRSLHFDVVSVRESQPNPDGSYSMRSGTDPHNSHLEIMNLGRLDLIREAFGLNSFQIEGVAGLPWAMYTIHASSGEDTDAILKSMSDADALQARRQMLQEILVERFHLRYHFVTREMPSYLLMAGKQPRLRPSAVKPLAPGAIERQDDPTTPWIAWHCGHPGCRIEARGQTMEKLAELFVDYLQAPIIDRTDLPGLWDFSLQWWAPLMSISHTPSDDCYPQPEEAFPQQLGLRLVRGKAPIQILIVDHIEAPTPN